MAELRCFVTGDLQAVCLAPVFGQSAGALKLPATSVICPFSSGSAGIGCMGGARGG